MTAILRYLFVLATLGILSGAFADYKCVQDVNCKLPDCFCATFNHPMGSVNIPQIVYFGFDDAVQPQVSGYYKQIFTPDRKNPNGCPITMTLYVSDKYTVYSLVNDFYKEGDEIGSHSVTHTDIDTRAKLLKEAREEKENIVHEGGVSEKDVVGWRSPNLKTAGDAQPEVLAELKYTYDISLTYSHDANIPWPFTLDYGYPYPCTIEPCPDVDYPHKGFWEVMVKAMTDPKTGLPCVYVDACRPDGEEAAVEYLWSNFLKNYETTKAPFGMNMHAAWFATDAYLKATQTFIDRLLELPDVYIVNVKQMMAWMKTPVSLANIKTFAPWGCTTTTSSSSNDEASYMPGNRATEQPHQQTRPVLFNNNAGRNPSSRRSEGPTQTGENNLSFQHENPNFLSWLNYINSRNTKSPDSTHQTSAGPTARRPFDARLLTNSEERSLLLKHFIQETHHQSIAGDDQSCIQDVNCKIPTCLCRSLEPPGKFAPQEIPQIVYIAVDSHIDGLTFSSLAEIFSHHRRNPNGCPISGTVYTPTSGNYSPYIEALKSRGIRMGIRGDSYSDTFSGNGLTERLNRELSRSRYDMSGKFGWRGFANMAPSDDIFKILSTSDVTFDNSVITNPKNEATWPYTLDFGLQDACDVMPGRCPSQKYPGLWVVPVVPLTVPGTNHTCIFADTCPPDVDTEEKIFNMLMVNFRRHYSGKKAPFGLNLHSEWLYGRNKEQVLAGITKFLDDILTNSDVVIVSIEQMLQWMISPDSNIQNFPC